jgi:KDO2-lipid IV(A) lauroyltransferase
LKRRGIKKKIELVAGRIALKIALMLSGRLSDESVEIWSRRFGNLIYTLSRRYRTVAETNLAKAFPEWDHETVRQVARTTFRNFVRAALLFFRAFHLPPEKVDETVVVSGMEHIEQALAAGNGLILITAHYGNWELAARWLVRRGYKVNVVARSTDDPTTTSMVNRVRENGGYNVIDRETGAVAALRCLKRNEVLCILPDQNVNGGIFVDFFGRPVATALGPAMFALRSGAPVVCAFAPRGEDGRTYVTVQPPLEIERTGDDRKDAYVLTQKYTRVIEDEIRKDPAQWLWLHDRWRRSGEAPQSQK